jgi:hypothetical protein
MNNDYATFELRRQSDDLVYVFDRTIDANGKVTYGRRDQPFSIEHRPGWGWVAWDDASQSCMGRPWNVLPNDQPLHHPPEGDWVSRKDAKSYVYRLVYLWMSQTDA